MTVKPSAKIGVLGEYQSIFYSNEEFNRTPKLFILILDLSTVAGNKVRSLLAEGFLESGMVQVCLLRGEIINKAHHANRDTIRK